MCTSYDFVCRSKSLTIDLHINLKVSIATVQINDISQFVHHVYHQAFVNIKTYRYLFVPCYILELEL